MVVLPRRGGYWVEGAGSESPPEFSSLSSCNTTGTMPKPKIDQDETALAYRKYFYGKVKLSSYLLYLLVQLHFT